MVKSLFAGGTENSQAALAKSGRSIALHTGPHWPYTMQDSPWGDARRVQGCCGPVPLPVTR
jgi:hypothetical protein